MRQSVRTGLVLTAAGFCAVVLFVILFMLLNHPSGILPGTSPLNVTVTPISSPNELVMKQPPLPVEPFISPANQLSNPAAITYPQHLSSFQPGAQAPMKVTSIIHHQLSSKCITALAVDQRGRWWIGTEGQGIFCYSPYKEQGLRWQHFTKQNFAPENVYAIACDGMGRIWAGSMRHGVSVFNGKQWWNYDLIAGQGYGGSTGVGYILDNANTTGAHWQAIVDADMPTSARAGPLGQRVFGIVVSPVDGDVWIATAKGLTRYHVHKNTWQYYTRVNGLPADQFSCLVFAPDGTLYAGTQCNGIAIGSPKDHYHTWIHIPGPIHPPIRGWGVGLPDNRINSLIVVPRDDSHTDYRVYAGTDSGLAFGEDQGQLWQYIRGRTYILKVQGMWHVPPTWSPPPAGVLHNLLTEDYITALATDIDGNIWIGFRNGGFEIINAHHERIFPAADSAYDTMAHDFIASMAPLPDGGMLVGGYESGLFHVRVHLPDGVASSFKPSIKSKTFPPLPAGARAPTVDMLQRLLFQVKAGQGQSVVAASLGSDWRTEGDWLGHYGVSYAKLCDGGPNFQTAQDQFFGGLGKTLIRRESSPHQLSRWGDMRYYVAWYHSQSLRTLYDPDMAQRVEGEWNDAGGYYPQFFDGPDMWLMVKIPRGLYRLSFYFHNKDGESGKNDRRDYAVKIYPKDESPAQAWADQQPLAISRVMQFWGGMYSTFLIKGPGDYQVRLQRSYSFWMTVAGMFLDRIAGPKGDAGYTNLDGIPLSSYHPPRAALKQAVTLSVAYRLWKLLNQETSYSKTDVSLQWPDRILAYRYAQAHHFPTALLARWRWQLRIWLPADRQAFDNAIAEIPPPTSPVTPPSR